MMTDNIIKEKTNEDENENKNEDLHIIMDENEQK